MSHADLEKAYFEAVDLLAHTEEADRLLTQRLEQQELELAKLRRAIAEVRAVADSTARGGLLGRIRQIVEALDQPAAPSQAQEPPACPGEP